MRVLVRAGRVRGDQRLVEDAKALGACSERKPYQREDAFGCPEVVQYSLHFFLIDLCEKKKKKKNKIFMLFPF